MSKDRLIYFHDPMCSWCYGFRPTWRTLLAILPEDLDVDLVVGGLAPDTDEPMPNALQAKLQSIWREIEITIPGTQFNFDFWSECEPRRATWDACRAVLAARSFGRRYENAMIEAIQNAYYREARNPSDRAVLTELAEQIGLREAAFAQRIASEESETGLQREIAFYRASPAQGFPSLVLEQGEQFYPIVIDYSHPEKILARVDAARK